MRVVWALACLPWLPLAVLGNFQNGDFIQMSRKAQYTGARTHWHDLLGRHCPRFGLDSVVVVPLPKPKGYEAVGDYKLQLSFDHERLATTWLPILMVKPTATAKASGAHGVNAGPDNVHVPFIDVQLTRRGNELIKVMARSIRVPENFVRYFAEHPTITEEYKNATQWPKHILIRYQWRSVDEVDSDRGFIVLLYGGLMVLCTVLFSVVSTHKDKLAEFMRDMVAEEGNESRSGEKGD